MKLFWAGVMLLMASLVFAGPRHDAKLPSEFDARVTWVTDGDTFRFTAGILNVEIHDTCRMSEYNAPEMHGKEKAAGEKAKRKLYGMIFGKTVRIKTSGRDKYGRWLCTATAAGASVGARMREYLKDYTGRDKYLWHPSTPATAPTG